VFRGEKFSPSVATRGGVEGLRGLALVATENPTCFVPLAILLQLPGAPIIALSSIIQMYVTGRDLSRNYKNMSKIVFCHK
jgi:hypothetical protein